VDCLEVPLRDLPVAFFGAFCIGFAGGAASVGMGWDWA